MKKAHMAVGRGKKASSSRGFLSPEQRAIGGIVSGRRADSPARLAAKEQTVSESADG